MKKLWIAAALALCLVLAGCGKVTEAEEVIAAIGTVSQSSESAIAAAEALVAELSERQQGKVENLQDLHNARALYEDLLAAEAAIDAIGKVTPDSLTLIEAAEGAYDALPEEQKAMVKNQDSLENARDDYEEQTRLIREADAAVEAIGEVSLQSEASIEKAAKAVAAAEDAGLTGYFEPAKRQLQESQEQLLKLKAQDLMDQIGQQMEAENYETAMTLILQCQNDYPRYADTELLGGYMEEIGAALEKIRPRNGKFFNKRINGGEHKIVIHAGEMDVLVKVEDVENPKLFVLYYVRAGESFFFNIASGIYDFRYATGPFWFGDEEMFGSELGMYTAAAEPLDLELKEEDGVYYFTIMEIYLNDELPEEGTDMESVEINAEDF